MIRDLHIGGRVVDRYDFHATVIGPRLSVGLLYDGRSGADGGYDRFHGGYSEVRLTPEGIHHRGNGGGFCSYMFGVDVPETDTLRRDVRNRLFMHGARYDEREGRLRFSNDTAGFESWERIFNEGHAFANFYFFVQEDDSAEPHVAQERILRAIGKSLKRADLVRGGRDGREVAHQLYEALGRPAWTLFVVKVLDANAQEYSRAFRGLYSGKGTLTPEERRSLDQLSQRLALDPYQRERIQLDVLYNDEANKRVIDQYKDALAAHLANAMPEEALLPRLNLLRAVLARNSVPPKVFDRLDALLLERSAQAGPSEPEYMRDARMVIRRAFADGQGMGPAELEALLAAKRAALEQRRVDFDGVLLDAASGTDHGERGGRAQQMRAQFEQLVSYMDLASTAWTLVSSIAYVNDFELTEERLEALLEARQAFDELRPGLFRELFLDPLVQSRYVGMFGRRRIHAVSDALGGDVGRLKGAIEAVRAINETARTHGLIDTMVRAAVTDLHERPVTPEERAELKQDVEARLAGEHGISGALSDALFDLVLLAIEAEYVYARQLLPRIVATRDFSLREDFLATSGLDLFRVEELEAAYVENRLGAALVRAAGR